MIEFSLAMGVKVPRKLVRLGVRNGSSPNSLLRESNAEIENIYQRHIQLGKARISGIVFGKITEFGERLKSNGIA